MTSLNPALSAMAASTEYGTETWMRTAPLEMTAWEQLVIPPFQELESRAEGFERMLQV
eukprot:CAMPEP_0113584368 /NCGR_PEP_ID=MMETSP0015_2-20120614/33063_1 /TAXON_ID=2838 /ORGANISM="Odontella" /LENGTH=57 /DNA_ID=CAMNT_0000489407 /DNA_START=76 /DNA_END=247 /DNA_ORIENTATION=+ /assembly_acc=CAM_ASM_000160